MAKKLYIITATNVKETSLITYRFMVDSGAPYQEFRDISGLWGLVKLRDKGENEIDPFKLARGESGAIGPDGIKKWQIYVGNAGGLDFSGYADEGTNEEGLKSLLEEMPDCVLLIARENFDRFQKACGAAGIELGFYHFAGQLSTK